VSYAKAMLDTYPRDFAVDADVLARCIDACHDCAQACNACADDCLSEDSVADLVKCIRLNGDCADMCVAAGRVANRQTEYDAKRDARRRGGVRDRVPGMRRRMRAAR
jgi:hypothetical protein